VVPRADAAATGNPAVSLPAALGAWGSANFAAILKGELLALGDGVLPLEQGTGQGGLVAAGRRDVTVLEVRDDAASVHARVGAFFSEIVGGCSCGDDPAESLVYCEIDVTIDKTTAATVFRLRPG
jgi:hypothetical protein